MKKILLFLMVAFLASSCTKTPIYPDPIAGDFIGSIFATSINNPADRYEQNDIVLSLNGRDGQMSISANDICLDGKYLVDMMLLPVDYGFYDDGSTAFGTAYGIPFIDLRQDSYYTVRNMIGQISPFGQINVTFVCAGYEISFNGRYVNN